MVKMQRFVSIAAIAIALVFPLPSFADFLGIYETLEKNFTLKSPPYYYMQDYRAEAKRREELGEDFHSYCPELIAKFKKDGYRADDKELEQCLNDGAAAREWKADQEAVRKEAEKRNEEAEAARLDAGAKSLAAEKIALEAQEKAARVKAEQAKANRPDARSCAAQSRLYVMGWLIASRGAVIEELAQGARELKVMGYTESEQQMLMGAATKGAQDQMHGFAVDTGTKVFAKKCSATVGMIQ